MVLHREGTADGYLGVDIQYQGDGRDQTITFRQEGLTKRIINALGLDSKTSTPVETPAKKAALGQNLDGHDASGSINYASVVGMLLYLGHSRPDISFATHQCTKVIPLCSFEREYNGNASYLLSYSGLPTIKPSKTHIHLSLSVCKEHTLPQTFPVTYRTSLQFKKRFL